MKKKERKHNKMSDLLKGNFKPKKKVKEELDESNETEALENQFEKEALKRLGGSIAFVAKKKVLWSKRENKKQSNDQKTEK